jgi:hypothetical protein
MVVISVHTLITDSKVTGSNLGLQRFKYVLPFLGALTKLRISTISYCTSVCTSVRMEQLRSHWKYFHEI